MTDMDFRWYLQSLTVYPVQQDRIDASQLATPRVWYQRATQTTETLVDGTAAQTDTTFDVEVCGLDIDAVNTAADLLRISLNGYSGIMLFGRALGVFVSDASSDYVPKNFGSDEGIYIAAFNVQIIS